MFFFSSEDKTLLGAKTSRDPLGLIRIWSSVARPVVPHVTEQTHTVAGFQLLVAALDVYEHYLAGGIGDETTIPLEHFFMLFEQAAAYSTYHLANFWPLPGSQRLSVSHKDDLILSLSSRILQNQLGSGVWGLYRGAAGRAEIIDEQTRLLSADFKLRAEEDHIQVIQQPLLDELIELIKEACLNPKEGATYDLEKHSALAERLKIVITDLPHRSLLKEFLYREGTPPDHIVKVIDSYVTTEKQWSELYYRELIEKCKETIEDSEDDFDCILKCENFISPAERIFYDSFRFDGKPFQTAAQASRFDIDKLNAAHSGFFEALSPELASSYRFTMLRKEFHFESKEAFLQSIITYHNRVAQERGREPWIVIEGDVLQCFQQVEVDDRLNATPGQTWDNDYYLIPLYNVYKSIEPSYHG